MSRRSNRLYTKWVARSALSLSAFAVVASCLALQAAAQDSGDSAVTRPLRQPAIEDLLAFNRILGPGLSPNGQWFAYTLAPATGNRETILRKLGDGREFSFDVGASPGTPVTFSLDGKSAAFLEYPSGASSGQSADSSVTVALLALANGDVTRFENVKRFAFNGRASTLLAAHLTSGELVLHEIASGQKKNIPSVTEFVFDSLGKRLFYTTSTGALVLREIPAGAEKKLDEANAQYQQLVWNESDGGLLSVVRSARTESSAPTDVDILWFTGFARNAPKKQSYRPSADAAFPRGFVVARDAPVAFTEDRAGIYFKARPIAESALRSVPARDAPAGVRVWRAEDLRVRENHRSEDAAERNAGFLMLARPAEKKVFQLEDSSFRRAIVAPRDRWAIVAEDRAGEQLEKPASERRHDVHVIDLRTGRKRLALMAAVGVGTPSPDGQRFWFYSDNNYFVFEMSSGQSRNITRALPTTFSADRDDPRGLRPVLGWSSDSRALLITDGWDVWNIPVTGSRAVNVTVNGKKDSIRYGPVLFDSSGWRGIDIRRPLYLRTYGVWSRKEGVARLDVGRATVTQWISENARIEVTRAAESDVFLHTRETVSEFPDYHVTNGAMQTGSRVTRANSQQAEFTWSSGTKLVNYSVAGTRMQAPLQLPASYEEGKAYPTIVLLGEQSANDAHRYSNAAATGASASDFNIAFFTGRGYAVLLPEIAASGSDPGAGLAASVGAAVRAAVESGIVDSAAVGLYGRYYGGWQAATLVSRDTTFAAALLVAPITDLAALRSRVAGGNESKRYAELLAPLRGVFDDPALLLQNSPIYAASRIKTPVLIHHNVGDAGVEFAQGVDFYNALRRHQRPVVLLEYPGEGHVLSKTENQTDFALRSLEFFDHHLKGGAAPSWWR